MTNQAKLYKRVSTGQHKCGLELINMAQIHPNDFVLDIGSGTGNLTFELAKQVQPNGRVYAIEPDMERMKVAKQETPNDINNIVWHEGALDSFLPTKKPMFNVAYSNYVFHWIKEQKLAVQNVYDNLLEGGRFAFCCAFGMSQVIRDLCEAIGKEGEEITSALHFTPKNKWLEYFEQAGFKIKIINAVPDYEFQDIDEVMTWWEATTHGKFSISKLGVQAQEKLRKIYPGDIIIYQNQILRLLAEK